MDKSTCVIIINFNAGDALLRSVSAVLSTREPLRLIVMDNASTDGSCEKLRNLHAGNVRLSILENACNLGFGPAVNACSKDCTEPYLLILNPDCELFPDTLAKLRTALEQDQQAALSSPLVVDGEGNAQRANLRSFPEPWKAFMTASGLHLLGRWFPGFRGVETAGTSLPKETCRSDAVSGACMLLRKDMFKAVGGFDPSYTLHFEDLDLMYRLRQHDQYSLFVPSAKAFHATGTSSRSRPWWVHRQKHLGMQRFYTKHYADRSSVFSRVFLKTGIWLHYLLTLPLVLLRR